MLNMPDMMSLCPHNISGMAYVGDFSASTLRKGLSLEAESIAAMMKKISMLPGMPEMDLVDFRRGSDKVKKALAASALAMADAGLAKLPEHSSTVGAGVSGAFEENMEYFSDYTAFGRTSARGHLFVGTLPSTPVCECSIALGLHGRAYYFETSGMADDDLKNEFASLPLPCLFLIFGADSSASAAVLTPADREASAE